VRVTVSPPRVLPAPLFYFPLRHGRYDVAPGLVKFGKDLGGGLFDAQVFQFDDTLDRFLAAKRASRAEALDRYVCTSRLSDAVTEAVVGFIGQRLASEHSMRVPLQDVRPVDALDSLASHVQEDLAIVSTSPGRHWLSYLHVCLPNGWAPAEKIGKSFAAIHEPVAGMPAMNEREDEFANIMVNATGGLVRFAWGVTFDDELNHHPDRPRTLFDPNNPRAFLRVERQTIWGFPRVGAALFTIRTYLYDFTDLRRDPATREPLANALRTMPSASQVYKGIAPHAEDLAAWLTAST
jgi:hypothetical protein